MAAFAPTYHQDNNDTWLDRLVGDIIDPGHRIQCFTYGRNVDDDLVDDPDQGGNETARDLDSIKEQDVAEPVRQVVSPPPLPPPRSSSALAVRPLQTSHHHSKSDPVAGHQRAQSAVPQTSQRLSSRTASVKSYVPEQHDKSNRQAALPTTRPASQATLRSPSSHLPYRQPTFRSVSGASMSTNSKTRVNIPLSQQRASTRTSLGRTRSQQKLSDSTYTPSKGMMSRSTSIVSVSTDPVEDEKEVIFSPHPGVRPLDCRAVLGEAAGPSDEDEHQYPATLPLILIIVGICLSVFIISVDRNVVTTAIPRITEEFKTYSDIGWYGSAYFITASGFQPLYGRVYMSFDTRWTFLVALFIFEAGSAIGGASPNSMTLIIGRAIQGVGSAGILTGSFVVGTHSVRLRARPILFAFVGVLYGVGALAGPLIGGAFTDYVTWRWAFWINLPVGAVTFVSVFFFFKPRRHRHDHVANASRPAWFERILQLDLVGNALCIGAAVQLFLGLQISESRGEWNNAPVIGLLCGCGVTVLIFIAWVLWKGDSALLPPKIMRQRTVAASCGAAFFIYGALLIHAYYLPIWFQAIRGDSAIISGVHMIPYLLANAVFALLAGAFVSKNGFFAPPAIIGCAIGTVGCGFIATLQPDSSVGKFVGFEILVSAGMGMAIQQGFSAVQTALPLEEVPIGTAAVVASQSLGGAIFVSIGNTILQDRLLDQTNENVVPGVNLRAVFQEGATVFRQFVPPEQLPALINLYNDSLQAVFIAAVPLCGLAFLCSLCMEWRSVRTEQGLHRAQPGSGTAMGQQEVHTLADSERRSSVSR